jgi:leucyl aminopeptidase (aminopeptidase T)
MAARSAACRAAGDDGDDKLSGNFFIKEPVMGDARVGKLARILVDYSIEAGEGDQVLVSAEVGAGPLIGALYARLLQVGATPVTQIGLPGMQELFFEHAQELHYKEIPQVTHAIYEGVDAQIGVRRASANVLFDEKLGGTVYLAIGRSYAKTGGKNDSSVHTDLVCDLREGGELYADGELIQENGNFLEFDLAGVTDAW